MNVEYLVGSPVIDRVKSSLFTIARNKAISGRVVTDYNHLRTLVKTGKIGEVLDIGDRIVMDWYSDANTKYDLPWDVVNIGSVVNEHGETVPGLWLQSHWALPGIQFDGNEAFWHCDSALATGTYHITMGNSWGSHVVADKTYQFTLTQAVPAGGQLVFTTESSTTGALPDTAVSNWRVRSYSSPTSTTQIEMVTVSEGSSGTSLGTLSSSTKYSDTGVNNMQRASYGYNRWSQSGIRQWLNSDAAAGAWWEPKNVFDRPPEQLTTIRGFMAGLPDDFLEIVRPVKVTTALNTVSDSEIGTSEDSYERFFLPSLEQEYIVPQLSGVEGSYWPYWKERLELSAPQAWYASSTNTNENHYHIRYAIENHTSAQTVRLRSACRGYAFTAWYVYSTGYVNYYYYATHAYRSAPACVIC